MNYLVVSTEVGVNMQPDYMIKFSFDQESGSIATDEETIIIGFSTQEKKGTLMLIRNDDDIRPEYISIEMNNNGKDIQYAVLRDEMIVLCDRIVESCRV